MGTLARNGLTKTHLILTTSLCIVQSLFDHFVGLALKGLTF